MFLSGESAGTTTSSYSPVRRASGVTLARVTGDLLVRIAPSMTRPLTRMASPFLPRPETNCARPIVPPAPPMFSTLTPEASLSASSAAWMARAVWSQPPPGLAGAMMSRLLISA